MGGGGGVGVGCKRTEAAGQPLMDDAWADLVDDIVRATSAPVPRSLAQPVW